MIAPAALRGCCNYVVESPDGQIGTVAEIRYAGDPETPIALAIRAGRAGPRLLIVPISQLTSIRPTRHRVTLQASPDITTTERIGVSN